MSRFKKHHIPFYTISLCIFCFDQITKLIVIRAMPLFFSFKLIPGILFFTHIRNTGAAFGIFPGYILPLIIIGTIISSAILYFHFMVPEKDRFMQISLALILGGSLGNLFDRIFRGYVVDFIDFRFWPAFNIADIAVNLGIFFIVLSLVLQKEKLA